MIKEPASLKRVFCTGVASAVAVFAPAAVAAPVIVDTPVVDLGERVGKISGYGDVLVWSGYSASDATFSLVVQRGGQAPQRLGIGTRNRPFDVDAGPDRDGKPALVYSRCRKEPKQPEAIGLYTSFGLPGYPGGSACDIYKYSLAAGSERKLSDISIRSGSEFMPSIWRGKVAFLRQYPGRKHPLGVYLNRRDGSGSRQLRRGWRRQRGLYPPDSFVSLELRGRRLAYESTELVDECDGPDVETPNIDVAKTYITVVERGRKPIRVAASCNNDARQAHLAGPVWAGSTLIYAAERGPKLEMGQLVGRSPNKTKRTLGTYAIPDFFIRYLAANEQGIYGAVRKRSDGHAHVSRLLDTP